MSCRSRNLGQPRGGDGRRMPELYVDGAWIDAAAGGRRAIHCPADGTLVAEVDEASAADVDLAIAAAYRAFHEGPGRPRPPESAATCSCGSPTCWSATARPSPSPSPATPASAWSRAATTWPTWPSVFRYYGRVAAEDAGRVVDTGQPRRRQPDRARTGRGLRADRPLELPAAAGLLEGRTVPGRREHLRAQAERAHAAHLRPPDAAARGGRSPGRCRQPRARRRSRGRCAAG